MTFKGKRVVIAGGTKGIGLAIARRFGELGAHVVAGARKASVEIEKLPFVDFVACDMMDPGGPDKLIAHATRDGVKIDALVTSVGGGIFREEPAAVTDQQWSEMLDRSFMYVVRICRAAVSKITVGSGAIINISSIAGQVGWPTVIDYAAAKAALDSYSKSLSIALAPRGIRVNTIAPGSVLTPLWTEPGGLSDQFANAAGISAEEVLQSAAADIPLRRLADPAEIAELATFLASPAASYITGSCFRADGGYISAVR